MQVSEVLAAGSGRQLESGQAGREGTPRPQRCARSVSNKGMPGLLVVGITADAGNKRRLGLPQVIDCETSWTELFCLPRRKALHYLTWIVAHYDRHVACRLQGVPVFDREVLVCSVLNQKRLDLEGEGFLLRT